MRSPKLIDRIPKKGMNSKGRFIILLAVLALPGVVSAEPNKAFDGQYVISWDYSPVVKHRTNSLVSVLKKRREQFLKGELDKALIEIFKKDGIISGSQFGNDVKLAQIALQFEKEQKWTEGFSLQKLTIKNGEFEYYQLGINDGVSNRLVCKITTTSFLCDDAKDGNVYGHSISLQPDGDKIFLKVMTDDDPNAATLYEKIQPRSEEIQPSAESMRLKIDDFFKRYEKAVANAEAFSEKSTLSVCKNYLYRDRLKKVGEEFSEILLLQLELGSNISEPSTLARLNKLLARLYPAQLKINQKLDACASMVESVKEIVD